METCCSNTKVARSHGITNAGKFSFTYVLTFCTECGMIYPVTSNFNDGKMMNETTLKDLFLTYVEKQRAFELKRFHFGSDEPEVVDAHQEANSYRRMILDKIEELEQ
jgi:hypothetical protein